MARFRHLLLESVHAEAARLLGEGGHDIVERDGSIDPTRLNLALAECDVVGIRSKTTLSAELINENAHLVCIGCFCIGTNQVELEAAASRGIPVFNAPFSNTRSVAELTIAEIIALHRRLTERSHALHQGQWNKSSQHAHEVRGRTLGIVGYGHIGSQLSVMAEALGMRVIYFDIAQKLPLGNATPVAGLDELLAQSDVVSIHVPETHDTRGMFDAHRIAKMRRGSFLINNARGSIVNLEALATALHDQRLGGAALDVYPQEPAANEESFDCPLSGCRNVILTPHIGGSTEEAQEKIAVDVALKILRYLETGTTTDAVNVPGVELPRLRADQHRVLHFHRNVPGVLSKMHQVLAVAGININAEYLQSRGEVSYVILDVDPVATALIDERLGSIEETIRMRVIS